MKKVVKEYINESEYTDQYEKTLNNYKEYQKITSRYSYIKTIIEDNLEIAPNYRIYKIQENQNEVNIWFSKSAGMQIVFSQKYDPQLLFKYKVFIQFPGNQEYGFIVSIKK